MERKTINKIVVRDRDVEDYHNLNCENTIPIYVKGAKYSSLFELLVNVTKIDCGNYLITYNDWHGFEHAIQVKKKISLIHKE